MTTRSSAASGVGGRTVHSDNHLYADMEHLFLISQQKLSPLLGALLHIAGVVLALTNCTPRTTSMSQSELSDFATRYAAAWSSQNPASPPVQGANPGTRGAVK